MAQMVSATKAVTKQMNSKDNGLEVNGSFSVVVLILEPSRKASQGFCPGAEHS
jgi:hypothetical protein